MKDVDRADGKISVEPETPEEVAYLKSETSVAKIKCSKCSWEMSKGEEGFEKMVEGRICPRCPHYTYIYPEGVTATEGGCRKVPEDEWKSEAIEKEREEREAKNKLENERLAKEALADRSVEVLEALRALEEIEGWLQDEEDIQIGYDVVTTRCSQIRKVLLRSEV